MRVLQISKFYDPVRGGIEAATRELTEGLNRAGVRTDVLCANQHPWTQTDRFAAGYDVVRAASWGRLLSTSMAPALVLELRRALRGHDLLHLHMPDPMAALALWLLRPKLPVVVHWHSDVIRQKLALRLYEPLQRWLLARADAIITTSEPYTEASEPLRPWRHKVQVIPIGISDNRLQAVGKATAAIRQRYRGRKIVFALGRMTYYKGFDVLIDAAAALPDDCVVLIGGEGETLQSHRAAVARRGLAGKLHLLGHIEDDDLPNHFAACDVFCMPSTARAEAYGVAMLEAMVMARPVVAAALEGSGMPWINADGHTGFNVPVGQSHLLASALERLLANAAMRVEFGAAARQRYLAEFTADLMTHRTIALYSRLAPAL